MAPDPRERAPLAEVVEWCRRRLDADAGPAVWREVIGVEATVPGPVRVHVAPSTTAGTLWLGRARRRTPGRSTALIAAVAVTAGALVLTGLTWLAGDRFGFGARAAGTHPSTLGPTTPARSALSPTRTPPTGGRFP
jgi:eukaryotic-like serine/threonine-protein kinase